MSKTPSRRRSQGRPRVSVLTRAEQLRVAKRAQRARDREAGLVLCQIKLRTALAAKLRAAVALERFDEHLERFLDDAVIDASRYPGLALLCGDRKEQLVTDWDAFNLYESNWHVVDKENMPQEERGLIGRLATKFGEGVLKF